VDNCKNCDQEITGKFCSNCGLAKEPQRIDRRYIVGEISSVLNFDKGIFYTIKELFIRPGETVKRYIDGDRRRIVKPIIFLIICSLIYTVGQQFLSYEAGYITFNIEDQKNTPVMVKIFQWFSMNFGYANILMAVFIALWIKLFFKKYDYNYYEIYILLCYILGSSVLIYTFLGIVDSVSHFQVLQIGLFIVTIYCSWAIAQFFDRKKKINYVKGFLSYIFGLATCMLIFMTIGLGLDILLK